MHVPARIWLVLVGVLLLGSVPCLAADAVLDEAVAARDAEAVVKRMYALAEEAPQVAVHAIPAAYAKLEALSLEKFMEEDRYQVLKGAIGAMGKIRLANQTDLLKDILKRDKEWQARFLVIQAIAQDPEGNPSEICLLGIKDENGTVCATAARFLGRAKKKELILPLISAMEKWEKPALREDTAKGRNVVGSTDAGRAWLACRDALHRLTGVSMHSYIDYRNYWGAHKEKIDPSKVDIDKDDDTEAKTGLLFGMEITGINICFILDISGSMEQSDPPTPEQLAELQKPRTYVGEDPLEKEIQESRRRILRAKRELTKVVRSLPENKNINLIVFGNDAAEWKKKLQPATTENREECVTFIEGLVPKGVTVTDDALALAFNDPAIDTIYLITDGAPTHIGLTTTEKLPPDAKKIMSEIRRDMRNRNYLRGVRLFTLGFEGAEEDFLKQLSKEHAGRYLRIR